jgi:hypothetical protein
MTTPEDAVMSQASMDRVERARLANLMRTRRADLEAARALASAAQVAVNEVMLDLMALESRMDREGTLAEDDWSAWTDAT